MLALLKLLRPGTRPPGPGRARPQPSAAGRRVWRITDDHPQGAWVDADTQPSRPRDSTAPAPFDSWTTSSMDLRDGVQVVEGDDKDPGSRPH